VNHENLERVQEIAQVTSVIHADELAHGLDRTLLVGTITSGARIHVYLKDGSIHRLVHADMGLWGYAEKTVWPVGELACGDVFRAEWSDFDFVCRMVHRGAYFNWIGFNDSLYRQSLHRDFQGPIKEDL